MTDKYFHVVTLVLSFALVAGGAEATEFTMAVSSDWAVPGNWTGGVPDSNTLGLIGTAGNPGVSASIGGAADAGGVKVGIGAGGSLTVEAAGSLTIYNDTSVDTDVLTIGASGGSSVTASATLNGEVDIRGWYYVAAEKESHSLDIGAEARASVTIGPGALIATAYDIGVGMDAYWDGGYAASVYQGPGSTINITKSTGLLVMGAYDSDSEPVHYIMDHATIRGGMFHAGGTLEIRGSCAALYHPYRARSIAGAGRTILKLVGEGAALNTWEGLQLRGVRVDVGELVVDNGVWTTVLDGTEGDSYWPDKDIDFVPGTDPLWNMRLVHEGGTKLVQVMYVPEPATLSLLAISAFLPLFRRRK